MLIKKTFLIQCQGVMLIQNVNIPLKKFITLKGVGILASFDHLYQIIQKFEQQKLVIKVNHWKIF